MVVDQEKSFHLFLTTYAVESKASCNGLVNSSTALNQDETLMIGKEKAE